MRNDATSCFAALLLAGVSLVGCGSTPSDFSTSFASTSGRDYAATESLLRGSSEVSFDEDPALPRMKPSIAEGLLAGVEPKVFEPKTPLQCVPFAREASGIDIYGDARLWWKRAAGKYPRTRRPQEGAVFVMKGYQTNRRGHVAVVRQILDDRTIVVDHANWGNDGRIYMSAPMRDESAKNDWSKVRVWFTPAGQWGQRIYRGKGFILPTTSVASGSAPVPGLISSRN